MGCTAVVSFITPERIVVANAGDSRAVLCRGGWAVPLSEDHKPSDPLEQRRIKKAGGTVEKFQGSGGRTVYRTCGVLSLTRAIGNLEYKKATNRPPEQQIICATPDVREEPRHPEDEFLIICCDGVSGFALRAV